MQLKFTEDIVPVTDFRNNAADILTQLSRNGRPIVLTQRGRASAVLLDVAEYQRLLEGIGELERRVMALEAGESPGPARKPAQPGSDTDALMAELEKWIGD